MGLFQWNSLARVSLERKTMLIIETRLATTGLVFATSQCILLLWGSLMGYSLGYID
jgi:hypothetical protein